MKRFLPYALIVPVAILLVLSGCEKVKETFSQSSSSVEIKPSPRYLDFNDVLIPADLIKDSKDSVITNGHGRLVLSGRVQSESLAQFFVTSMYSDGWTALNQYKYQSSIKLFFKKSERIATILIAENPLGTRVEIWVIPQGKI